MIVRLSDWLTSTLRSHEYSALVCSLILNYLEYSEPRRQSVRLVSLNADPSTRTITAVFRFVNLTDEELRHTTIVELYHFTGFTIASNVNVTIPSEYTWGQVALVETITLVGAV
jgi:hypothetical protein